VPSPGGKQRRRVGDPAYMELIRRRAGPARPTNVREIIMDADLFGLRRLDAAFFGAARRAVFTGFASQTGNL